MQIKAPLYLSEMLSSVSDNLRLRSHRSAALPNPIPRSRTKTLGPRSFAVPGPTVWNSLPSELGNDSGWGTDF